MSKLTELLKSHHVQLALAVGASIIALAWVSKRVLPEPMGYLAQAFPPFVGVVGEAVVTRFKGKALAAPWIWVALTLLSTVAVIVGHLISAEGA